MQTEQTDRQEEGGQGRTAQTEEISQEHPKCYISTGIDIPPARACTPITGAFAQCDGCDMQNEGVDHE